LSNFRFKVRCGTRIAWLGVGLVATARGIAGIVLTTLVDLARATRGT
jgi:hypothetical protein